jgi:hypothetical protein
MKTEPRLSDDWPKWCSLEHCWPYVHTRDHTSAQKVHTSGLVAVRPLRGFQIESHLVQPSSYPLKLVSKATKWISKTT